MPFAFDGLSAERFFAEYWRKKPVLIKGGASKILDFEVDVPFFRKVVQKLERSPLELVNKEPGFIFAQKMDEAEPRFRAISRRYEDAMSVKRVWFDGVYTTDTHTIGCHYDHSDNFVMQQSGVKHWKLASPKMIPADELRARMLESREVGHIHMPDECEDFVLEASDVLYIPLFWAHWGVSFGTAMSVSLVLNADAPVDVLAKPLRTALSEHQSWALPLPAIPRPQLEDAPPPEVDRAFEQMFQALSSAQTRRTLQDLMWREIFVDRPSERVEEPSVTRSGYGSGQPTNLARRLDLPESRLRALLESNWPEPSLESLLEPGEGTAALSLHFAQRAWSNAADALVLAHERFSEAEIWPEVVAAVRAALDRPDEVALGLGLDASFYAWIFRVREAATFSYAPRFEEICANFGDIQARLSGDAPRPGSWLEAGPRWLVENYPRGRRYGGRMLDLRSEAEAELRDRALQLEVEARSLDDSVRPELTRLLSTSLPMMGTANQSPTHSIEPFFGTVLVDVERATLPDLIFEAGRFKARMIAKVVELERPAVRDRLTSPFDGSLMSPTRLFVEAFGRRHRALVVREATNPLVDEAFARIAGSPALSEGGREISSALTSRE